MLGHPRRLFAAAVLALTCCAASSPTPLERDVPLTKLDDAALLETLWRERGRDLSVFSDAFLAAVPEKQLRAILQQAIDGFGPVESVVEAAGSTDYTLTSATHVVPIMLTRDGDGLITGLLLRSPVARSASLSDALAALTAEGVRTSWLLVRNGERVDGMASDEKLAIGSAFKLWVLDAYRRAVEAGDRRRDEVTVFEERHRSWPSGILQGAPAGLPVTLETLATLMISMSDNTATDVLVEVLGRESVEALSPFEPLQTTGEFLKLKLDPALETRYAAADANERRRLLGMLSDITLPPFAEMPAGPLPGAEWYASVEGLCEVIERVADEPSMSVPTGLVDRSGWARVADKGGSEQGVLNATMRLVADDGTVWCFAVTWNGEADGEGRAAPLDALTLRASVASVVARLAQEP